MTASKDVPKTTRTTTGNTAEGFTDQERAAIKERAAELRAEGKKGAKQADGLQAVLDSIAKMAPQDRTLAGRVHVTVTANAPGLSPKTWYGMPAYANAEGKIIVAFKNAASSTLATQPWSSRTRRTSSRVPTPGTASGRPAFAQQRRPSYSPVAAYTADTAYTASASRPATGHLGGARPQQVHLG